MKPAAVAASPPTEVVLSLSSEMLGRSAAMAAAGAENLQDPCSSNDSITTDRDNIVAVISEDGCASSDESCWG